MVIKNEKLRRVLRVAIPAVLMPAAAAAAILAPDGRWRAAAILAAAVLTLALFAAGFERRQTGSRRLVLAAVLTALSVAGRFIPVFKPVSAMAIIAGMYLGGETGFLVGSMSALISNIYFGQGPWTPFQMLAWGLVGLFAGLAGRLLTRSRAALLTYGALAGVLYSAVMDVWTVLWLGGGEGNTGYLDALWTALPFTVIYAVSNVIFLWFLAPSFGEKLTRIRRKYGV